MSCDDCALPYSLCECAGSSEERALRRRAESVEAELRETASELERVKVELLASKPLFSRRMLEARVTEATALLDDVRRDMHSNEWNKRYDAFLARAPARPAAPANPLHQVYVGSPEQEHLLAHLERHPDPLGLSQPAAPEPQPEELACPGCGRPMARVGGAGARRGWTCVNCNAAGDPEEDH